MKRVPKIFSHPEKLLSDHVSNVALASKSIINSKELALEIKKEELAEIAYLVGLCHDFGKVTSDFQKYIQGRNDYDNKRKNHGFISALFGFEIIYRFCKEKNIPIKYSFFGALSIKRHHGNLDNIFSLFNIDSTQKNIMLEQFDNILNTQNFLVYTELLKELKFLNIKDTLSVIRDNIQNERYDSFDRELFKLTKETSLEDFLIQELLYSVLIDSDKKEAAGLLAQGFDISRLEIKDDIVSKFIENQHKENPEKFNPKDGRDKQLVKIKNNIFKQCVNNSSLNSENKIYSITAPTGLGKTYTSFATALRLKSMVKEKMDKDFKINYILPFTTIIDQNYDEFYNILMKHCPDFEIRENDYILKHHYLAAGDNDEKNGYLKKISEENKKHYKSDSYLNDLLFINSWDAKIVVSTYVQLMHTLIGGKSSFMNKFHNIVNSIIILDEVQCISLKYWELFRQLVLTLSEKFNVYFIFLTATQPLIFKDKENQIQELSNQAVFKNSLIDRVNLIDTSEKELTVEELYKKFEEEELNNLRDRYIFVLNTKRSSFNLYNIFKKQKNKYQNHELFYLSTNLTKNDRNKKLCRILSKEEGCLNKPVKKFILITTQLIEAGVDISSDACYRDLAPVDSIIQSAGRVNRFGELKKQKGVLKIVKIVEVNDNGKIYYPHSVYGPTLIEWTTKTLDEIKPQSSINFPEFCKAFFELGYNQSGETKQHCNELKNKILELDFKSVIDEFKFIQSYPSHTIFILNEDSKIFLDEYKTAFNKRYTDDNSFGSKRRGELKRIRAKFSNFTIEISPKHITHSYLKHDIKELGEEFYYIDLLSNPTSEIYSNEFGFNLNNEDDNISEVW